MKSRFVCHSDGCPHANVFHKNSTVVELPDGDLLAAWFAGKHGEGRRDQKVYTSRLPAGAGSWEDAKCLVDVEDRAVGVPVLFNGPDGELWLLVSQMYGDWLSGSRLFYKRSMDNGHTWKDLELLIEKQGIYLKNKPLYLEDEDRWILGADSYMYEAKPYFIHIFGDHNERPGDFPILVGGDQIAPEDLAPHKESQGLIYPTAVERSDGSLLAYMRPKPGGRLFETRSYDRGINWTTAEETDIPNPCAGFDVVRTESGNLVLIDNPLPGERPPDGRNELALLMSEDEGETWPHQMHLEQADITNEELRERWESGEQMGLPVFTYGNIIQDSSGTLQITYEFRRSGIKHVEITESEIEERAEPGGIVTELL